MSAVGFIAEKGVEQRLDWVWQQELMQRFNLDCFSAEELILRNGYLPSRYQRNQQMITTQQQLQLQQSRVAIIGCGGLGGYILEELARLGVGQLIAVDPDTFEESNLNRQLLSSIALLGTAKVTAAQQRIAEINPAVRVTPLEVAFSKENGAQLLDGADLLIDAVDSIPVRLELAEVCNDLNIPLVHGAIAGWFGQVATVYPGDAGLQQLYRNWSGGKGVEAEMGNPSFTPAVIASLQVAEACKLLLGQGRTLGKKLLSINLFDPQFEELPL